MTRKASQLRPVELTPENVRAIVAMCDDIDPHDPFWKLWDAEALDALSGLLDAGCTALRLRFPAVPKKANFWGAIMVGKMTLMAQAMEMHAPGAKIRLVGPPWFVKELRHLIGDEQARGFPIESSSECVLGAKKYEIQMHYLTRPKSNIIVPDNGLIH